MVTEARFRCSLNEPSLLRLVPQCCPKREPSKLSISMSKLKGRRLDFRSVFLFSLIFISYLTLSYRTPEALRPQALCTTPYSMILKSWSEKRF